ncbi:MAG: hypothetical protein ACFFCQ_07065 [Promethearchaeota archaeon]
MGKLCSPNFKLVILAILILPSIVYFTENNRQHTLFYQNTQFLPNQTASSLSNANYLVDFIGNWSKLESGPVNSEMQYMLTNYTIKSDNQMFRSPTFELVGNGKLTYNLTKFECEVDLPKGKALLFHWMDFGRIDDGTYIGVVLRFHLDNGTRKDVYIGKRFYGGYQNCSSYILKFESPVVELGTVWEQWGVENDILIDYFDTSTMILRSLSYVHQATISYNGFRRVRYTQPLIVDELTRQENSKGAFLGFYSPSSPTTLVTSNNFNSTDVGTSNITAPKPINGFEYFSFMAILIFFYSLKRIQKKYE